MSVFADQAHDVQMSGEALNDGRLGDDEAHGREWSDKCRQIAEASPQDAADLVLKASVLLIAGTDNEMWEQFARDVVRVLSAA